MSRYPATVPTTPQIAQGFKIKGKVEDLKERPIRFAWGLDIDGYFIQLYITDHGEEIHLEDGLTGVRSAKIIEKLERWGILDHIKETQPERFKNLLLDLPL